MALLARELEYAALGRALAEGQLGADWLDRLDQVGATLEANVTVALQGCAQPRLLLDAEPGYVMVAGELLQESAAGATTAATEVWLDEAQQVDEGVICQGVEEFFDAEVQKDLPLITEFRMVFREPRVRGHHEIIRSVTSSPSPPDALLDARKIPIFLRSRAFRAGTMTALSIRLFRDAP